MAELLIATANAGKFAEIEAFLKPSCPGLRLRSLAEFTDRPLVKEDGLTFRENAEKKAVAYSDYYRMPCLSDDSGLCVNALGGAPGVLSARYAGPHATDAQNIQKLLNALSGVPHENRAAHFECVMALRTPGNPPVFEKGELHGIIATLPKGTDGFGYDPVFFIPHIGKTLAEIPLEEKNRISHRAAALAGILKHLF